MTFRDFSGRTALITGASSGMGVHWARQLADAGVHLILTARRAEALEALAQDITGRYPALQVSVVTADLGDPRGAAQLEKTITAQGRRVDILINNAGYGAYGRFDEIDDEKEAAMIQVDIQALVRLTKTFARGMKARGWGRILQVASIGAYQPCPTYSSYGAAKAFVLSYGLAVNQELRGTGVTCTVLSPGVTATEFFQVAGQSLSAYQKLTMMPADKAVKIGLKALAARRPAVVPGWGNKVGAALTRLLDRSMAARVAAKLMS